MSTKNLTIAAMEMMRKIEIRQYHLTKENGLPTMTAARLAISEIMDQYPPEVFEHMMDICRMFDVSKPMAEVIDFDDEDETITRKGEIASTVVTAVICFAVITAGWLFSAWSIWA